MNWSVVGPAVFSLIGVALGTSGSLIGQYLATRTSKAQDRADRDAALRAERKDAILVFLEAAQDVERLAATRQDTGDLPEDSRGIADRMWFRQKCIDIVGSPQLRGAAYEYAAQLSEAVWDGPTPGTSVWDFLLQSRLTFLEAARQELGIPEHAAAGESLGRS